ncbi:DNA primase family protein [Pectobacterium colocasium]|uniref:DNA primase family protein n=1 Tax=Pectobacterium colocasium TaxID=2878098 RepID=UPI003B28C608
MSTKVKRQEAMSDALFSCLYLWVNGHVLKPKDVARAIQRHSDSTKGYGKLAVELHKLADATQTTYEWLCDQGLVATDAKKQREKRMALAAGIIGQEDVKAQLLDDERINRVFPLPLPKKKTQDIGVTDLSRMGASQRGEVLRAHYGGDLAVHGDSDTVHHYNGVIWEPVADKDLQREMAQIFIDEEIAYSQNAIKSAVETMKLSLPVMGATARNLIGFSNGVFDTRTGQFRDHSQEDWLLIASELPFSAPAEGETLATHAPSFWKWLSRSVGNNKRKADRVLSALFMVLANRYDWQLFLEVTGPGGSGKSVFAEICTMLAGKANTVSASMKALEDPRDRALVVGYSLIIMPDMTRYAGDGAGIKAITGGDKVSIDPKHKAPYSTRIPAVVLAVNNNAMTFSDRSGGISRRRVIFNFSEVVPENERDPMLPEKIEGELAVIIRHLLTRFAKQDEAKRLLHEQQKSEEALAIKREGDSLVDFCGYLMAAVLCDGMFIGNAEIVPFSPRRYLYHAYLAYMRANGLTKPVSLMRFGIDMPGAMAEYGKDYQKRKTKLGIRSNVTLNEDSDEWMPQCDAPHNAQNEEGKK